MEIPLRLQGILLYVLIPSIISLIFLMRNKRQGNKKTNPRLPEPAGAWPVIGHLTLLGTEQLLHRTFADISERYGPVFAIRLGVNRVLIVSNGKAAKQCLTDNDKIFSTRPRPLPVKLAGYDELMFGFAPYGPYWRDLRKLSATQLLSARRLDVLKNARDSEVNLLVKGLNRKCSERGGSALVELKERLGDMTMNIILRMIAGKRYDGRDAETRRCQKAFRDLNRLFGMFFFSDAIPSLGWLDVVNGSVGELKRAAKETDYFLGKWVKEHREKRLGLKTDEEEQDFIDVMLSALDDGRPNQDTDTIIKATCLSLIGGASDTTAITLTWAMSLLLNNRHVLKKAQDKLDEHVGNHRQVDESDIKKLEYLQAIAKETLRLYPAAPLSVLRESMEDCTVANFHVPKGTQLLVNLWKMHRDPSVWQNPNEFLPERFLGEQEKFDVRGQSFEFLPFGSGRRMCPGVTFAFQVIHLALARLLHGFEFKNVLDKQVDMTECPGMTMPKATPLEVMLTPRLSGTIYGY